MGSVFEKFQRERDQQTENKAYERIEKVIEMLQEGIDVVVISKETGVIIERIKRLQRILK